MKLVSKCGFWGEGGEQFIILYLHNIFAFVIKIIFYQVLHVIYILSRLP